MWSPDEMKSQQGKEEGGKGSNVAWGEVSGHINCRFNQKFSNRNIIDQLNNHFNIKKYFDL